MENNLKNKTISGIFWQFCQNGFGQIVNFIVTVLLARLLMPEEFGIVAIAGMFIVITGPFVECGFGSVLIQKKDVDEFDYYTTFWAQLCFSIIVYLVLFVSAPLFSTLFSQCELTSVIRVLSTGIILGALGGIPKVILNKELAFKKFFQVTFFGTILSGIVGVVLAYCGLGVWALVVQSLFSIIITNIILYVKVGWFPKMFFSFIRFKKIFFIGLKYMSSNLIGIFFGQLKGFIIGLKYTSADLAYYNRGESGPSIFSRNIVSSINAVLFPVFSKLQDDKSAVKNAVRRSIKTGTFLFFPFLMGLAAIADNVVVVLYTNKWLACIPFMQIFCISECFTILNAANLKALTGMGKVDDILKMELYKKPVMIAVFLVTMFISPLAIAVGMLFYTIYTTIINAYPIKKYIGYSIKEQLKDISGNAILALFMSLSVYLVGIINLNIYLSIVIQVFVGFIIYIGLSELLKVEAWLYIRRNALVYLKNVVNKISCKYK